jgi:hypothetical protein
LEAIFDQLIAALPDCAVRASVPARRRLSAEQAGKCRQGDLSAISSKAEK